MLFVRSPFFFIQILLGMFKYLKRFFFLDTLVKKRKKNKLVFKKICLFTMFSVVQLWGAATHLHLYSKNCFLTLAYNVKVKKWTDFCTSLTKISFYRERFAYMKIIWEKMSIEYLLKRSYFHAFNLSFLSFQQQHNKSYSVQCNVTPVSNSFSRNTLQSKARFLQQRKRLCEGSIELSRNDNCGSESRS